MQKEHVFPRSKGGCGIKNKVLSCKDCNKWKGSLLLEGFKEVAKAKLLKAVNSDAWVIARYKNIIETCDRLLSGAKIRDGWHTKAVYYTDNISEKPKTYKH
jgi:hypothetical protein